MKKFLAAALMLGFATFASAQAPAMTTPATTTTTTPAPKMEKEQRMSHKPGTGTATTPAAVTGTTTIKPAASGVRKPAKGQHPDRMDVDMQSPVKVSPAITEANNFNGAMDDLHRKTSAAKSAAQDKVISKDAAGHDIHLGPDGGQYYINKEGTKTYLKSTAKVKVN